MAEAVIPRTTPKRSEIILSVRSDFVMMPVRIAVEGPGDVPVAKKILAMAGLEMGDQYVRCGKASLDDRGSSVQPSCTLRPVVCIA